MGRYGKSIQAYMEEITRFKLIPEQIELLDLLKDIDIKNLVISAGRGFSKTMLAAGSCLWFADEYAGNVHRDLEILLVSSQQRMYWHLNQFFEKNKERFGYDANSKKFTRLKHSGIYDALMKEKAEIISKDGKNVTSFYPVLATSKSVRSHRADIVIIDEAAEVPKEVIVAAIGCLTGDICKLVLISTPHKTGYFTEVASNPKEHKFKFFTASSEVCPWQQEAIKRSKNILTSQEYAVEVKGRPPTKEERSFFSSIHIDKCVMEVEPVREGGQDSWVEFGIDFGYNRSVLVIRERIGTTKKKVLFVKVWEKKTIEEVAKDISPLITSYNPKYIKVDSKAGMGVPVKGQLEKYTRKHIDYIDASIKVADEKGEWSSHKEQMLGQLLRSIREHQIIIPHIFTELITELKRYRRNMQTGDDIVDALALACYNPIIPLGAGKSGRIFSNWNNKNNKTQSWYIGKK